MAGSPEMPASLALTSVEAMIVGWVHEDGGCRAIFVEMHGHVFRDGSWVQAFNDPDNPLCGCTFSGDDAETGERLRCVWQALTVMRVPR